MIYLVNTGVVPPVSSIQDSSVNLAETVIRLAVNLGLDRARAVGRPVRITYMGALSTSSEDQGTRQSDAKEQYK